MGHHWPQSRLRLIRTVSQPLRAVCGVPTKWRSASTLDCRRRFAPEWSSTLIGSHSACRRDQQRFGFKIAGRHDAVVRRGPQSRSPSIAGAALSAAHDSARKLIDEVIAVADAGNFATDQCVIVVDSFIMGSMWTAHRSGEEPVWLEAPNPLPDYSGGAGERSRQARLT